MYRAQINVKSKTKQTKKECFFLQNSVNVKLPGSRPPTEAFPGGLRAVFPCCEQELMDLSVSMHLTFVMLAVMSHTKSCIYHVHIKRYINCEINGKSIRNDEIEREKV